MTPNRDWETLKSLMERFQQNGEGQRALSELILTTDFTGCRQSKEAAIDAFLATPSNVRSYMQAAEKLASFDTSLAECSGGTRSALRLEILRELIKEVKEGAL